MKKTKTKIHMVMMRKKEKNGKKKKKSGKRNGSIFGAHVGVAFPHFQSIILSVQGLEGWLARPVSRSQIHLLAEIRTDVGGLGGEGDLGKVVVARGEGGGRCRRAVHP